jgi:hypothetical protein
MAKKIKKIMKINKAHGLGISGPAIILLKNVSVLKISKNLLLLIRVLNFNL